MEKVLIVLLASLIGMLLCSGVALAGDCCYPGASEGESCICVTAGNQFNCEDGGGIWLGLGGCSGATNEPCDQYCTSGGKCVPEMSTIALLATGLICMAGYLRLRRKEG